MTKRSVVLGLVLALTAVACGEDAVETAPSATVERGRIERIVVATGTIEPEREVEVRPRISGIVEQIHVSAGDRVEVDQPLLEIDKELLIVRRREAEASLRGAESELRFARTALDRVLALHAKGASTEQKRDQARADFEAAGARVAHDRASLDSLDVQLRHATVRSPLVGKILDVYVEEGSAVSAVTSPTGGTALLSLAEEDRLHLEGLVDENEVARVSLGQTARVRTEAYPGELFEGRVRKIAPIGERRQNVTYFEVEVELVGDNARKLRPRMSGDAEIVAETVEEALWVPETALLYDGDRVYVEKTNGNPLHVEEVDVAVGIVDRDRVQVLSGLDEGHTVRLK